MSDLEDLKNEVEYQIDLMWQQISQELRDAKYKCDELVKKVNKYISEELEDYTIEQLKNSGAEIISSDDTCIVYKIKK